MAATSLLKIQSNNLLLSLEALLPNIQLEAADVFYWSPQRSVIAYSPLKLETAQGQWSLLHEASHALLGHASYTSDFQLLTMEVAAWDRAKELSKSYGIEIDIDHVEDCIDSYRDWLHKRSTCPTCGSIGLQHTPTEYRCHNCLSNWNVSQSRFCRPYRRKNETSSKEKSPNSSQSQTTFQ